MPPLNENQWRLGHKRPWWQWNVLTLFAALFVLIWMREILSLSLNTAVLLCMLVFLAWGMLPALVGLQTCRECNAMIPLSQRNFASGLCIACEATVQQAALERRLADDKRREAVQAAVITLTSADCPDCRGNFRTISLFVRQKSPLGSTGPDAKVEYYCLPGVEPTFFGGKIDASGSVQASKCEKCHRIFLHGIPS